MKRITSRIGITIAGVAVVLGAVSCAAPTTPTPTATSSQGAEEEPQYYGGTLNWLGYNAGGDPFTWDLDQRDWSTDVYAGLIFEKLVMGDLNKGPGGTGEFAFDLGAYVPEEFRTGALAESWETPDPNTIILHLRRGVRWQDKPPLNGREFVANDVVHTLSRWQLSPATEESFLNWFVSARALDDYTVELKGNSYYSAWQDRIAWGYNTLIWPPELMEVDRTDWKNLVGTGPFMIEDFSSGISVTYSRNPNYWASASLDGKDYKLPFVDKVVWRFIDDPATAVAALRTGKIDILGEVDREVAKELQETNPQLQSASNYGGWTQFLAYKTDVGPFNDRRVRQALSMAIDRQAIIDTVYGGDAIMLGIPFLPGHGEELYTPVEELPAQARMQFEFDPERAKGLLAEAGFPNGFDTTLIISTDVADFASILVANWADIGVKATLEPVEAGKLYDIAAGRGFDQMIWIDITGETPADALAEFAPGSYWNAPVGTLDTITDPDLRAFYEEYLAKSQDILQTEDLAAVRNKYKELFQEWLAQTMWIILPSPRLTTFWQPWVHNFHGEISTGTDTFGPLLSRIWIDQAAKKAATGE